MNPLLWIVHHRWRILLLSFISLLVISPISRVFEDRDSIITPVFTVIVALVILGAAERREMIWLLLALTLTWSAVGIATDGSGLFAGVSLLAPALFLLVLAAIFVLIVRWKLSKHCDPSGLRHRRNADTLPAGFTRK